VAAASSGEQEPTRGDPVLLCLSTSSNAPSDGSPRYYIHEPPGVLVGTNRCLALLFRYCRVEKQRPASRDRLGDEA
jgi:hypothetical protein